jgi:hypothetical protein
MLKAAFSEHEAYVNQELSESAKRINNAILDHDQMLASAISQNTRGMLKTIGRTWLRSPACRSCYLRAGAFCGGRGRKFSTTTRPSAGRKTH